MFDSKNFERHKNILSQVGTDFYQERWGQHHVELRPQDLLRWVEFCKDDLGYLTLVEMVGVDRRAMPAKWNCAIELVYLLFNMGTHQRINLHVHMHEGETLPSIIEHYYHAEWMEREQAEMLGLNFHRGARKLLLSDDEKLSPLRKDAILGKWAAHPKGTLPKLRINPNKSETPYPEESWVWKRFGILSHETMGNFEWQVCFDPKKVVMANTKIGFHHRGIEKLLEGRSWAHVMQLLDFFQTGAAPTYSTIFAKALEEMMDIKLPEKAQAIRIVLLELARIAEHLSVLYEMTAALRKKEAVLFLNAREKVYELFEKYCGHRQGLGVVNLGGVREDLPHGWIAEYQSVAKLLHKNLKIIHLSLLGQNNFRSHLDSAAVNAQTILQWGVGGPAMRASGLNFDLRKSQPFYFYQDIDFDVPVGIHGTSYDRYLIRYEELFQSFRIITQVLDNLPLGEVVNTNFQEDLGMRIEGVNNKWHYSSVESPNGEAGLVFFASQGLHPCRIKIKSPSFTITQALSSFVRSLQEWQLVAAVASLGIRKSELDR
jgi:NADH-quinone oxidoreductase subunit C/D